ncbi:MAG: TatD family hydrolase [Candidatus Peribacteraceae bacterium]|jgi:TatD DNase family protein
MIDSHCHLADQKFAQDRDAVINRAVIAGVDRMVTIADSLREGEQCLAIAEKFPQVFCTVGVHPHGARIWVRARDEQLLRQYFSHEKVVGIGEIGLDYHYDHSPRDVQCDVFRVQMELARELSMPAVVHCREAIEDIKKIIRSVQPAKLVLHCCTERWEDVEDLVNDGYLLGFTGIATYPHAEEIRRTIEHCPLEHMLIETDAPYLAPVPHRGKRNEPAFVVEVAKLVADIKGVPFKEVDRTTTQNTVAFYSLPS